MVLLTCHSVSIDLYRPDPIEHLWDVVKWEIHIINVQPTNLQQLRDAIMSIWTKISEEYFQHLVESMQQRNKAVLKAKGGPTRYKQGVPNKVDSECMCLYIYIYSIYYTVIFMIEKCLADAFTTSHQQHYLKLLAIPLTGFIILSFLDKRTFI